MEGKVHDHFYKIALLGDSGVGKTSILLRYSQNTFETNFVTTVGKRTIVQGWGWPHFTSERRWGGEVYIGT